MTSNDNQDKELLERYRRASDTHAAAPSEAVRAAILAEGRRAAEQNAKDARQRPFDSSRPAANDSRWKLTAYGTAGAALVAAVLFAPRLWESAPPSPSVSSTAVTALADKAAPSAPASSDSRAPSPEFTRESPQEVVVAQAARDTSKVAHEASKVAREPSKATGAAAAQLSAPAPPTAPASPPVAEDALAANAPAATTSPLASSLNAGRLAGARSASQPAALQSAAAAGDIVQATALLDKGAPLNERDELGRTPLMLAVVQSRPDIVQLLLDRGADPNIADSTGRTPLQQARQAKLPEIEAMLERAGAR